MKLILISVIAIIIGFIIAKAIDMYINSTTCPFCGHSKIKENAGYKYCNNCLRHWKR